MLRFKYFFLKEEQEVHHDITFMRGNPIHIGHQTVVDQVVNSAANHGGGHTVYLTRSHDHKKNPLTPEQKLQYAKMAFPNANIELTSPDAPTILHQASKLHGQGVNNLHVHVGSDRVEQFRQLLSHYNGQRGNHGFYKFDSINVYPVGSERSDEDEGVAGASATAMRDAAQRGDRESFYAMAPTNLTADQKEQMLQDTAAGMVPPPKPVKQVKETPIRKK
jgi:hypothetical protein